MVVMNKNHLIQFCKKQKLEPPVYNSTSQGPIHALEWSSIVTITLPIGNHSFSSKTHSLKKRAEHEAAGIALNYLSQPKDDDRQIHVDHKVALMVDVENLPKLISQLPRFTGNLYIYAFVGEHHPLAETKYEAPNVITVISKSTRQDGTDTCMQLYVGALLAYAGFHEYLIATRDHFGSALVDLISVDTYCWRARKATLVSTAEHVVKALTNKGSGGGGGNSVDWGGIGSIKVEYL